MVDGEAAARPWTRSAGVAAAVLATGIVFTTAYGTAVTLPGLARGVALERGLPSWLLLLALAGIVVPAAAAWMAHDQRAGLPVGLAVAGAGALVPLWSGWPWLEPLVRSWVLAVASLVVVGIVLVVAPVARARRWRLVALALAGAAAVIHLLGYDPFGDPTCARTCVAAPAVAADVMRTGVAKALAAWLTVIAAVLATGLALAARDGRRRAITVVAGAAGMLVAANATLAVAAREDLVNVASVRVLLPVAAVAMLGLVVGAAALRTRRARAAITRLAAELSANPPVATGMRGHVRGVQFAVPAEDRWVDALGTEVWGDGDQAVVQLSDSEGPALRLLLADGRDGDDVLASLTPALQLALRNARLAAVVRARVEEVRRSRRRVVATSDAERRRIERDLHDGAQQRLVSAAFHLRVAASRVEPDVGAGLDHAADLVHGALARLRAIAHGIFPAVLADQGLVAALDDLAAACAFPVTLRQPEFVAVDAETAMAAYATVATALAQAGEPAAPPWPAVDVDAADGTVTLRVEVGGAAGDLTDVADRVAAVGGELGVDVTAAGTRIEARLPCAS